MDDLETTAAKLAVLKEELAGQEAATLMLLDALLLVIRQQLPKLIPPMQQHFEDMAARPHAHLSEIAQGAMELRAQLLAEKLRLLQSARL